MGLERVVAGVDVPNDVNVIIEIGADNNTVKYEIDKETSTLSVDRFLSTAMHYPCNYGYIPHTLCEDGDPIDVLVMTPSPLLPGSVVRCRPIGMLKMEDESGNDNKLLALPISSLCPLYETMQDIGDIPEVMLAKIVHFFKNYKALESGKWTKVQDWQGVKVAKEEIKRCIVLYESTSAS